MYTGIFSTAGNPFFASLRVLYGAICLSRTFVLSVPPMDYRAHSRSTHNAGTRNSETQDAEVMSGIATGSRQYVLARKLTGSTQSYQTDPETQKLPSEAQLKTRQGD